ncbi:hypothetical protein [Qipengyuania huizhouensis]|uniref:hypothetical protein n=1 Tax=Qipengyuania huizhouensis TaxID=2867245 RepID=UPI001C8773F5|nr:hypothetical protein [Qipengyuania huizhouensis]MBX7459539.1 hypothetical protein [Qipengyuania huizhouensis]
MPSKDPHIENALQLIAFRSRAGAYQVDNPFFTSCFKEAVIVLAECMRRAESNEDICELTSVGKLSGEEVRLTDLLIQLRNAAGHTFSGQNNLSGDYVSWNVFAGVTGGILIQDMEVTNPFDDDVLIQVGEKTIFLKRDFSRAFQWLARIYLAS